MYKDILQNNLFQSAKKLQLNRQMVFQHDNDPKHTAHVVKSWFDKQGIERLIWPPFSPDMNPIEHLWDELERRMKKNQPKNQDQLRQALRTEWDGIGLDVTKKVG
jgi:transposase